MTFNRPTLAMLGIIAVLGAATLGLSQGTPAAPKSELPDIAASGEPVLLELFTSQGCSSCPPADKLAETLARQPGLVVIARPVTYWDRLGWKDTLASEANTELQRDYARRGLAGRNGVYTPQLVVDGTFGAVGSRRDDVTAGVKRYGGKGSAAIAVTGGADKGYTARISGTVNGAAELVLIAVTSKVEVGIGSGENGGRKVSYTNVLRAETRLASWQGGKASIAISPSQLKVQGADRYALVLRQPDGGKVLAARWLA